MDRPVTGIQWAPALIQWLYQGSFMRAAASRTSAGGKLGSAVIVMVMTTQQHPPEVWGNMKDSLAAASMIACIILMF